MTDCLYECLKRFADESGKKEYKLRNRWYIKFFIYNNT